jgi:hypothetical protein
LLELKTGEADDEAATCYIPYYTLRLVSRPFTYFAPARIVGAYESAAMADLRSDRYAFLRMEGECPNSLFDVVQED